MEKTSFSYKLESRPGQLLVDHLDNTARLCAGIRKKRLPFADEDAMAFLGEAAWRIGYTHDLGKATRYFQDYIHEKDEKRKTRLKNKKETHHGLLSALCTYRIMADFVNGGKFRAHRLFARLPILSFLAVKRHHGNPGNLKDEILELKDPAVLSVATRQLESVDREEFDRILKRRLHAAFSVDGFMAGLEKSIRENLCKEENKKLRVYRKKSEIDVYFLFQFLYSALLSADKSDASGTTADHARPRLEADLVDRYRAIEFSGRAADNAINPIRNEIYDDVCGSVNTLNLENRIFTIDVPTGTGKTLTGLSFALKLRHKIQSEEGVTPRIIYCLPFLSIIEQNFNEFEKIFQVVKGERPDNRHLLKHHHLAEIAYRFNDDEEAPADQSRFLIEGWKSEIVVTTFMQLFHTMISNSNRMLRKFNAMANAIVILDEVQTVPYKYWHLIRKLFGGFAGFFNTRFILMTATQPLIFNRDEIVELVPRENKRRYINRLDRITFINKSEKTLSMERFKRVIQEEIETFDRDDFLIVLNTINCSIDLFKHLKDQLEEGDAEDIDLYYLSTNIIPKHRLERINRIKTSSRRKIVVSTQMVEAGVDMDMGRVYRDFAPLDSLNQVAGRCNRNFADDGKKGVVTVFSLENGKEFYKYIYGKGDLSISKTKDVLKGKTELVEKRFLNLGDEYFLKLKESKSDDRSEYILEQLKLLNFEKACENKKEKFRLIDTNYPTAELFIEIDDEAFRIWRRYQAVRQEENPFERKRQFDCIKKDFYSYIISVPAQKSPGRVDGNGEVVYVSGAQLPTTYDAQTGFIREDPAQCII